MAPQKLPLSLPVRTNPSGFKYHPYNVKERQAGRRLNSAALKCL